MSYFGNVSSFPCLEFTAAFSRNQALFDARNDFPLFPQSTTSHFGHFAETFPILPGIPAIRTCPRPKNCMSMGPVRTDVAPSGDSLRSQSVSPWLPLWGSCHEVTERGNRTLSAPTGHLSHRARQGPHPSRACVRRASHLPPREGFGERIVTGGNPWKGPHQSADWFAMTCVLRWHSKIITTSSGFPSHLYTVEQLPLAID